MKQYTAQGSSPQELQLAEEKKKKKKCCEERTDRFLNLTSNYFLPFRTYGGFTNEKSKQEELLKLIESLKRDNVQFVDKPFYSVTYDPPFKLINRRNEVWVLKSLPQQEAKASSNTSRLINMLFNVKREKYYKSLFKGVNSLMFTSDSNLCVYLLLFTFLLELHSHWRSSFRLSELINYTRRKISLAGQSFVQIILKCLSQYFGEAIM